MNKGKVYTSYFSKLKDGIGIKLSIARFDPKWLKPEDIDGNLFHVAPPVELLEQYKHREITWDEYQVEYQKHINSNDIDVTDDISYLLRLLNDGHDVTLYCYEKDKCHRHIFGMKLKSMGFEVNEI